ncbi:MAG: hypothetical protein Q4G33_06760 [bacterium]|nr:hypothetical protein [bacterium]
MIQSITFGDKNTWDDWKILPTERPVFAPPKPKTTYIDVPGGNGALDLSESLTGYPIYENRTGSFKFRVMNDYVEWHERYTEIMEHLHGKSMNAILADDPDYFYKGRFTVDSWTSGNTWSEITIGYTVDPYKWSVLSSTDPWLWDPFNFETGIILEQQFSNIVINSPSSWVSNTFDGVLFGKAPISPVFKVSNSNNLSVRLINTYLGIDETISLTDGLNSIHDFIFYGQSSYVLMFKGVGTVSIDFRIGRL